MNRKRDDRFKNLYLKEREKIDNRLEKVLKNRKPKSLYQPGSYILKSKGKRIRPLLVLFSAKAVGGKFSGVYNAAVAVELLHNFTLVHDDIMDNADMRRGRSTLHNKYDLSTAILVGDSLLSIAYENLLKDCNGNAKYVIDSFTKGLVEVCEGQSLDTEFETRKNVSMAEYYHMIKQKTAVLLKMCCDVGAALGGGGSEEVKALARYGLNLGMAFQIQDDLLDLTAEEKKFGKKIGGDLIEGKKTYILLRALELAKGDDRKQLLKIVDNNGINPRQINKYKLLFEKSGVLSDAQKKIDSFTQKALNSLYLIKRKEDRDLLTWLAYLLLKRKK